MSSHRYFFRFVSFTLYSLIVFGLGLAFLPFKDVAAQAKGPKETPRPGEMRPGKLPASGSQAIPARISQASLSSGNSFTCAIKNDDTLVCWGSNTNGQTTAPLGTFTQVSASVGGAHACAINTDGTPVCWGKSDNGRTTPPSGTFNQVSTGGNSTCGVRTDGTLACWGLDESGSATPPSGTFFQVSAGLNHACAIRTNGALACWGLNDKHQANPPAGSFMQISSGSNFSCAIKSDNTLACWGDNTSGQTTAPLGTFIQVSAGEAHACALSSDGTVACWGDTYGQITPPTGTFTLVSAGTNVTYGVKTDGTLAWWGENTYVIPDALFNRRFVSTGNSHSCTLRSNGILDCWGDNSYGQSTPPADTFTQVSDGDNFSCGVKSDGTLACWGYDGNGQTDVPDGLFSQVSAGTNHTCGLKIDGTLACWGDNGNGQLNGIPGGTFVQLSAGGYHTCALRNDGTPACWGLGTSGQTTPVSDVYSQLSSGGFHTCGITGNGTLQCWGWNAYGQASPPDDEFTQVDAGFNFTCGISSSGSATCWGRHDHEQNLVPAGYYTQVSAGSQHVCGVKNDGTLVCWGNNDHGQAPALAIYPSTLQDGVKNTPYNQTLTGIGVNDNDSFIFSIVSGSLPHGNPALNLSSTGTITGTPDTLGTSNFTIQMVDADNFVVQQPYSMVVGIRIAPGMVVQLHNDDTDALISTGAEVTAVDVGTSVHDQATLSGTNGMPTGTVVFTSYANKTCVGDETPAGTITLTPGGLAHPSLSAFVTGNFLAFTAHYSGDTHYIAVTGPCQYLEPIILRPSFEVHVYDPLGRPVTEAPVGMPARARAIVSGSFVPPTGKVIYSMYDNDACTDSPSQVGQPVDLSLGEAPASDEFTQTSSGISFKVHYNGDINYNSGDSECAPLQFGKLTPGVATHIHNASHTPVTIIPIASMVHDNVVVSGSYLPPTGSATFTLYSHKEDCTGAFTTQTIPLDTNDEAESAAFRTPNTGLSYQVQYNGDINYYQTLGSCQPLDAMKLDAVMNFVFHDASHTEITSAPVGLHVHTSASFSGAADPPTGQVDIYIYSNLTCAGVPNLYDSLSMVGGAAHSSNEVVVPTSGISFKVHYAGDDNYKVIDGDCIPLKMASITTLTSSKNPAIVGKLVIFTITVTSPAGPVTGQVTLYIDGNPVQMDLNTSGVVTYSTGQLAYGSHTLSAAYAGSPIFLSSTSGNLAQEISKLILFWPVIIGN